MRLTSKDKYIKIKGKLPIMAAHKVPKYKALYTDIKEQNEGLSVAYDKLLKEFEIMKTMNMELKRELQEHRDYPIMPATYIVGLMKINNNKVIDNYHELTESEYKLLCEIYLKKRTA